MHMMMVRVRAGSTRGARARGDGDEGKARCAGGLGIDGMN